MQKPWRVRIQMVFVQLERILRGKGSFYVRQKHCVCNVWWPMASNGVNIVC